jgi:cell division protein FtsB
MIDVRAILRLHEVTVAQWHEREIENRYDGFLRLVCLQHQQNFRLWHQEDVARSPDVTDAELANVKRIIDKLNQRRNDLIEQIDDCLIDALQSAGIKPDSPVLNTETPGSAIDRLSIVSLRLYHMEEQAHRADAEEDHRAKAHLRLETLHEQRRDLAEALGQLWTDISAGRKRLKVYRQFKMYNDPTMNPYLYAAKRPAA